MTLCSYYFSLIFIKNLINVKSKQKKQNILLFVLHYPGLQLFIKCTSQ